MKTTSSTVFLSVFIACTLFFVLGCGLVENLMGRTADRVREGATEKVLEGIAKQLGEEDALLLKDLRIGESLSWPDWVPGDVPKYGYGDLIASQKLDESGSGLLIFANIQMNKDPFNAYVKELEKKGWETDKGWEIQGDVDTVYMQRGKFKLAYTVGKDEDGAFANITLFGSDD